MHVTLIGIDLAKNIFQVCGVNQAGKPVFNSSVKRANLMILLSKYPDAVIAMEACSGSNFWGRSLIEQGFEVRLIPPQHVKPFVKGNKNDRNDAFAITEAAMRPNLKFVHPRSVEQTDLIQVHRLRERKVNSRTALINQLRGFLAEFGIVVAKGKKKLFSQIPDILEDPNNGLTASSRALFNEILNEWRDLNDAIERLDKKIQLQSQASPAAKRLMQIKGVGEKIATAVVAHAGDGSNYKNGRHFSANLGLAPKEHSSGGKQSFGSITKRGNEYLRKLLLQGAWSIIIHAPKSDDRVSRWACKLIERRGKCKAAVAVANKLARIIWSMLHHKTEFLPQGLSAAQ